MKDIWFNKIKIQGFRGRNFVLDMNEKNHSVFIMDGNTGKTTTIELLRWCFRFPASKAENKFQHMWNNPAHVLDDTKQGEQNCSIEILFSAVDNENRKHHFKYRREVIGEYIHNYKTVGDKIKKIYDSLEIDKGKKVIQDDLVYRYLADNFYFDESAGYFCFDGEKAREMMQLTANKENISNLVDLVNRRVTHKKIEQYKNELNELREKVLKEAKSRTSDRALNSVLKQLENCYKEQKDLDIENASLNRMIKQYNIAIRQTEEEIRSFNIQINNDENRKLVEKTRMQLEVEKLDKDAFNKRSEILSKVNDWIYTDLVDRINEIKKLVQERGKLPEPYRDDLINTCIQTNICQICGRELDEISKERVKELSELIAPHNVQSFLSSDFILNNNWIDFRNLDIIIKDFIEKRKKLNSKIENITLSLEDTQLEKDRDTLNSSLERLNEEMNSYKIEKGQNDQILLAIKKDIKELEEKHETLKEYKIILDNIENSIDKLAESEEEIKKSVINIISEVISEGVSSILGSDFSAKLSLEEGLLLGENEFYSKEKGGYSGRLILSYCFAEAMTLVDPIVIDTPSGNIGSHREKLANHLLANHKQVILLCLPTEINDFAPVFDEAPKEIKNKTV